MNTTLEHAIETNAAELGHDLRLKGFDTDGNPEWVCWNKCGIENVRVVYGENGWRIINRPWRRCR